VGDLPHTNEGYIQEQMTAFRRSTDEQVYKQIGSDINYIKDQQTAASISAAAILVETKTAVYSAGAFSTDGSGNYQGSIFTTPNGLPILFAVMNCVIGAYRAPQPMVIMPNIPQVAYSLYQGSGTQLPVYDGTLPFLNGQIVGANNEQLYALLFDGVVSAGKFGSTPSWPYGTAVTFYYTVVYATS